MLKVRQPHAVIDYELSPVRRMRDELREDPGVLAAIRQGWDRLPKDSNGYVRRHTYVELHTNISKLILGDELSLEEAAEVAEEDWQRDAVFPLLMLGVKNL